MQDWPRVQVGDYWEGCWAEGVELNEGEKLSDVLGDGLLTIDASVGRATTATQNAGESLQGTHCFRHWRAWVRGSNASFQLDAYVGLFRGDTLFGLASNPQAPAGTLEVEATGTILIPGPFRLDVQETGGGGDPVSIDFWFVYSCWHPGV